ncbi:MAG: hypothetical protein PHW43_06280 [Syntrophales bacterium]|nr:hypothetical protein [Syntrophales bacterium]
MDEAAVEALASEYAGKLEEFFNAEVARQLEIYGKLEEYERMLLYDTQYMSKYLNQTIPGFPAFRMEIFARAKKAIAGL